MNKKNFIIISGGTGNGKSKYIKNYIKTEKCKVYNYNKIDIENIYKISKLLINKIIVIDELIKIEENTQYELYSLVKMLINKKNIKIIIGVNETYNFIKNLYEIFEIKLIIPNKKEIKNHIKNNVKKEITEKEIEQLINMSENNFHIINNKIYKINCNISDDSEVIEKLIYYLFNNKKDEYINQIDMVYRSGLMLEDIYDKLCRIIIKRNNCEIEELKNIYITILKYSLITIEGNNDYINFNIMCKKLWEIIYKNQ